jgi:hypothetical protein
MQTPTVDEMRAMFRAHTEAALKVIVEIMTTGSGAKGESVRLAAAKEILNRGWGRATSYKEKDKDDGPAKADRRPEWRSREGKTYAQVYAEKAAEVAAEEAAKRAAAAASPEPPATAQPDAGPASPPRGTDPTGPDPTGYIAKRALFSAPAPARANGAASDQRRT